MVRLYSSLRPLLTPACNQGVEAVAPANGPPSPLPMVDMQRCRDRETKALQVWAQYIETVLVNAPLQACTH